MSKDNDQSFLGDMCRLHIRVKCDTDIGQTVVISGSCFALGCNNKNKTVNLVTTPDAHPLWYSLQPFLVPRGQKIEYRYGLVEGASLRALEKKNNGALRCVIPSDADTTVEDDFSLIKLEGFGQDSEMQLFEQMKNITRKSNPNMASIASQAIADETAAAAEDEESSDGGPVIAKKRLFLVCYHLPLKVRRKPSDEQKSSIAANNNSSSSSGDFEITWNDSIIAKSNAGSIQSSMHTTWVGTLSASLSTQSLTAAEKQQLVAQLKLLHCIPIFLDDELSAAAYFGFCKTIMWPTFHNVDQLDHIHAAWNLQDDFRHSKGSYEALSSLTAAAVPATAGADPGIAATIGIAAGSGRSRSNSSTLLAQESNNRVLQWNNMEEDFYSAFQEVNKTFAAVLLQLVKDTADPAIDGSIVWVHDYHLMELPKMLRDSMSANQNSQSVRFAKSPFTAAAATSTSATANNAATSDAATYRDLKIVFFLHIPFPTSQIFRTLPKASELLESMTCADVVGFHSFDHARHFLNAAKRALGHTSSSRPGGMITLKVGDRELMVSVSHVSIEADAVAAVAEHVKTLERAQQIREKYAGRQIVVGVDACQRLSGVAQKFAAFDKMLSDSSYGRYFSSTSTRSNNSNSNSSATDAAMSASNHSTASTESKSGGKRGVVLLQRCIRGGSRPGDEETTSSDLKKMVADINRKYVRTAAANFAAGADSSSADADGGVMIDYAEVRSSEMDMQERLALWLAADVMLITSIREGLNLMPLEYVFVRRNLSHAGAVVVSEFSTCSSLLNGSLKINPFAPLHVADAIEKALSLSATDADYRRQRDLAFISSHPSSLWTRTILNDLEQLSSNSGRAHINPMLFPKALHFGRLLNAYDAAAVNAGICQAASRVMIFDYGGTLLSKEKSDIYIKRTAMSAISGRKPTSLMMEAIRQLSEDPRNVVLIVTGLTKLKLGDTFSDMKNVSLATSNGLVYSWGKNISSALSHRVGKRGRRKQLQGHRSSSTDTAAATDTATTAAINKHSLLDGRTRSASSDDSGESLRDSALKMSLPSDVAPLRPVYTAGTVSGVGERLSMGADMDGREWEFLHCNIDWEAIRDIAMPIISRFTFRTNGTCQTPRIPGIGWSYFGADPEWGRKQAEQLKLELEASLANFDVKVASLIQGSIEVVPRVLDKGIVLKPLLEKVLALRAGRLPRFLLLIGDEESDDRMVESMHELLGQMPSSAQLQQCKVFTTTVSKRVCPAQFYVSDVDAVEDALLMLSESETTVPALAEEDDAECTAFREVVDRTIL